MKHHGYTFTDVKHTVKNTVNNTEKLTSSAHHCKIATAHHKYIKNDRHTLFTSQMHKLYQRYWIIYTEMQNKTIFDTDTD